MKQCVFFFYDDDDSSSLSRSTGTVVSPGEKIKRPLRVSVSARSTLLLAQTFVCVSFSPIKVQNFESHYIKLQADSNYLLSEEFEVTGSDITTLYNLLCLKHKSFVTFLWVFCAGSERRRPQPDNGCCPRAGEQRKEPLQQHPAM